MAGHPRKPMSPNPFYVALLLASTLFVVTALAYFISPSIEERAHRRQGAAPGAGSRALAAWFDRNGPTALGIEFGAMLVFGVLAMATDHWFPSKPTRAGPGPR